jgi:hypothetical protein
VANAICFLLCSSCITTLVKTIWGETEPNNIQLHAATDIAWTPSPLGVGDTALMEIATQHYQRKESMMINRCHLYLQIFSNYDIITYDGKPIHPEIMRGDRITSRTSNIFWVDFPKPPKSGKIS